DILEHAIVEREVSDDLLEPPILIFKVFETASFVDIQAAILGFPAVVSLLANAVRAASIGNLLTCLNALEDVDDLFFGELRFSHREFSCCVVYRRTLIFPAHLLRGYVKQPVKHKLTQELRIGFGLGIESHFINNKLSK